MVMLLTYWWEGVELRLRQVWGSVVRLEAVEVWRWISGELGKHPVVCVCEYV